MTPSFRAGTTIAVKRPTTPPRPSPLSGSLSNSTPATVGPMRDWRRPTGDLSPCTGKSAVGIEWLRSYEALNDNLAKALTKPTPLAYSVSAEWLLRQGRPEEALAEIDRALALGPNEADTHVSRARILNATGR